MELNDLRLQIDEIDRSLIALLEKRMDVATAVADYKLAHGLPVLDTAREQEKYASIRAQSRPETAEYIVRIFTSILAESRSCQHTRMENSDHA